MTKLERKMRQRERQRLADLNRRDDRIFQGMLKISLVALAVLFGIIIWIWAAGEQAELEAQAAVLRAHRITAESMYAYGPGTKPGQNQNCPIMVESFPEVFPEDGEPPEAIEIKAASQAEAVPEGHWESLGEFTLTFYCPCYKCSEGWGHQTASGATAVEGITVAADPSIPFGTHVLINGEEYIVQDRGGKIKGNKMDIFMESHSECLKNGIQKAEVFVRR